MIEQDVKPYDGPIPKDTKLQGRYCPDEKRWRWHGQIVGTTYDLTERVSEVFVAGGGGGYCTTSVAFGANGSPSGGQGGGGAPGGCNGITGGSS